MFPGSSRATAVKMVSWSGLISWYSSTITSLNFSWKFRRTAWPSSDWFCKICNAKCSRSLKSRERRVSFSCKKRSENCCWTSINFSINSRASLKMAINWSFFSLKYRSTNPLNSALNSLRNGLASKLNSWTSGFFPRGNWANLKLTIACCKASQLGWSNWSITVFKPATSAWKLAAAFCKGSPPLIARSVRLRSVW